MKYRRGKNSIPAGLRSSEAGPAMHVHFRRHPSMKCPKGVSDWMRSQTILVTASIGVAGWRASDYGFLVPGDLCDAEIFILKEMDHGVAAMVPTTTALISGEKM